MDHRLAERPIPDRIACAWLATGEDPEDNPFGFARSDGLGKAQDELPYLVELWDEKRRVVELVLAVTAHGSIGYAAYYAAVREYPNRFVTLRLNNRTIARSMEPRQ